MYEIESLSERKMWIFILLPWIISISNANNGVSNQRIATADAFRAKCDSLAFRSRIVDGVCYFAINNNVPYQNGNLACNNALSGASMYFAKSRDRVLKDLFFDPAKFHDVTTSGQNLNVLCALETRFSCDQGELGLPGRCIIRSDKPVTFSEARSYCRSKGSRSVAIRNEYENKVFTGYLNKNEAGWLHHKHEDSKWSVDGEPVDYWRWFFDGQTPMNLKCSDDQHAVLTSNARETCSSYGRWKVDDSKNKNVALCVKPADCLFCPQPEKPEPDCSPHQIRDRATKECVDCPDGLIPNDAKTKCVVERLTSESFASIPGEAVPCYCDVRSKGRLTTNGLCRRKGTSKCDTGLINIAGLCVGNAAVQPTTRSHCLSLLMFKTGTCVANEMLYEDVNTTQISAAGPYSATLDCGNQLSVKRMCSNNPLNASIRAGMRSDQVVYFNSADEPVFVGSCRGNHRRLQETYCSVPKDWWDGSTRTDMRRICKHARGGLGWTKSYDTTGCVLNQWKASTTKCGPHAIHVEGKGGSQCFGYEKGAWMSDVYYERPWNIYDGVKPGPGPSEKQWLVLPRVVIVPGNWFPERIK